jgi:hypothetical protein
MFLTIILPPEQAVLCSPHFFAEYTQSTRYVAETIAPLAKGVYE